MIIEEGDNFCPNMQREMELNGIAQAVKVPIHGLRGDIMGFITCHSIQEKNNLVGKFIKKDLVEKANQISGYLLK